MNRAFFIVLCLSITGCVAKPPVYNSDRAIVTENTNYPEAGPELAGWLANSTASSIEIQGERYTKVRTFFSALGAECQKIRILRKNQQQADLFACKEHEIWVVVLNETSSGRI